MGHTWSAKAALEEPNLNHILDDAEDVLGGFEDAEEGEYIMSLLFSKALYGSWCCSRTNFHHPGATAFFNPPPKLPLGREASQKRQARKW